MRKIQLPLEEIRRKYEQGQSTYKIAKKYLVGDELIRGRLIELGVKRSGHHKLSEDQLQYAINLYQTNKNVSLARLAEQFNITGNALRLRFIRKGIKIRPFREMVALRNKERTKKIVFKDNFDRNFGYLIGVLYGDGYLDDEGVYIFSKDKEFVEQFAKAIEIHFGASCNIRKRTQTTKLPNGQKALLVGYRTGFYSVRLKPYLENIFGSFKSNEWEIPVSKVLSFGKEFCYGLIGGLYDSDGHYLLQFAAGNEGGINSVRSLLINLGFSPTNIMKRPTAYYMSLTSYSGRMKFFKEVTFKLKRKQAKLKEWLDNHISREEYNKNRKSKIHRLA